MNARRLFSFVAERRFPPTRLNALAAVVAALSVVAIATGSHARSFAAPGSAASAASAAVWPVFNVDPARSGVNPNERVISSTNVARLVKTWSTHLPAVADSTPVYENGILYFTMKNGGTIALNATTGAKVWQASTSGPNFTTSSPALDPSGQWVYGYGLDGFVHKYDAATGHESVGQGWPAKITNMPSVEKGGPALNLANGYLYMTTGGYPGDQGHYEGHVVAVELATGNAHVFNTLCSNIKVLETDQLGQPNYCSYVQSGVWARGGAVVDTLGGPTNGHVFIATGNGDWNGTTNWGDSVIELSADLSTLIDTYTPTDQGSLDSSDTDLGSSAPTLLPDQPTSSTPYLALQVGKDGVIRLLNRQNLSGKGRPGQQGGELQTIQAPGGCEVLTAPTVWTDPSGAAWIFVANDCGIAGYRLATDSTGKSTLAVKWSSSTGGTSPVLANGVLFVARPNNLDARDPATGNVLWSASRSGASIGGIHWESPIVVNGVVVLSDESGQVTELSLNLNHHLFVPDLPNGSSS